MAKHYAEVLECPPPNLTPLLALFQQDTGESLSREQDKAGVREPERFASLVTSLRRGESIHEVDGDAWKHLSVTVLFETAPIGIVAITDRVEGASVTFAPSDNGVMALVTAPAASWRDAVSGGVNDSRESVGSIFSDLYRKFCLRGYAALWKDYSATTSGGRLLLEHK